MITPMPASAWAKGVGLPAKATTVRRKTTSKARPARRAQTRPAPPASSAIVISRRATRWGLEYLLPSDQAESECCENRGQDDSADLVLQPDIPPEARRVSAVGRGAASEHQDHAEEDVFCR